MKNDPASKQQLGLNHEISREFLKNGNRTERLFFNVQSSVVEQESIRSVERIIKQEAHQWLASLAVLEVLNCQQLTNLDPQ